MRFPLVRSRRRAHRHRAAIALVIFLLGAAAWPQAADPRTPITDEVLLRMAYANSGDVRLARLAVHQSSVTVAQAKARRGPQVSGSVDFSYLTNPLDPIILRTGELGTYDVGGIATPIPPGDVRLYEGMEPTLFRLNVVVDQPVYTWGKLDLGVDLAEAVSELRRADVRKTRQEVETTVRSTAAAIRRLNAMAELAQRQVDLARDLADLMRSALESGSVVRIDVLKADVGARQAELARTELLNELATQLVSLRQATGITDLQAPDLGPPGEIDLNREFRPKDDLVRDATENNPDLASIRQAQRVATAQRFLADANEAMRPDLGLRLEFSFQGPRIPLETDWYGKDEFNLTASIGLQSTLYDGGLSRGDTSLATIDQDIAVLQLTVATDRLDATIQQRLLEAHRSQARISYLAANAELLAERLAVRHREFDAGVGSRDAVVQAELDAIANELESQQEQLSLAVNIAVLGTLVGGPLFQ